MGLRLGIDMDDTIVNFSEAFVAEIDYRFSASLDIEKDIYVPNIAKIILEKSRANLSFTEEQIDERLWRKGFFYDLKPLPGAIEAICELNKKGHEIFFITKITNWHRVAFEKTLWLKKHLFDIDYHVAMVDSARAKSIIDVDVIIDDDMDVLRNISLATRICIKQPWNRDYCDKMEFVVDNIGEAVKIINEINQAEMKYWQNNEGHLL